MNVKYKILLLSAFGLFLTHANIVNAEGDKNTEQNHPETQTEHQGQEAQHNEGAVEHQEPAMPHKEVAEEHQGLTTHEADTPAHQEPAAEKKRDIPFVEMRSALKKGKDALEALIHEGANVNALDSHSGMALVHEAASEGNVQRLQTLKDLGANLDEPNKQGATAMYMAARVGHINVVKKLVELGAKTDVKNAQGKTAYDAAKANGNKPIMDFLVAHPH